jgi:hypothetical protein
VQSEIEGMIAELDLTKVELDTDKKGHIVVSAVGEDDEFVINLLASEYGKVPETHEVVPESRYASQLLDVGKVGYGIYTDIGMTEPRIDALIPLHQLREQMGMQGHSLRKIAKSLVLVDNLPAEVTVTEVHLDKEQVEAEFAPSFLQRFESWVNDDHERLLVFGANQQMIENALRISRHEEDIYQIEKLGLFEFSLQCKRSTRASGIIAAIGPKLRGVPMHLFIPSEVEANRNAKA